MRSFEQEFAMLLNYNMMSIFVGHPVYIHRQFYKSVTVKIITEVTLKCWIVKSFDMKNMNLDIKSCRTMLAVFNFSISMAFQSESVNWDCCETSNSMMIMWINNS